MRSNLRSFASKLVRVTENIGAVLMLTIIIVNFLQVFFRYVMMDPLGWTEEVMRYSVVWVTFLTAGAVLWHGEHMVVDALDHICPPSLRKAHRIAVLLAIIAFCLVMAVYGLPLAIRNMHQFSPSARITMIIPYMAVVVGPIVMIVIAVCAAVVGNAADTEKPEETEKGGTL